MTAAIATLDVDPYEARAHQVIDLVAEGKILAEACKAAGISASSFVRCLGRLRNLAELYAHAQSVRADIIADETITIADSDRDAAKARNRITARQWRASKLAPKTYGERLDIAVTQSISVTDALTEARARLLRPVSDQPAQQVAQDADFIEVSDIERGDAVSLDEAEPDIFS